MSLFVGHHGGLFLAVELDIGLQVEAQSSIRLNLDISTWDCGATELISVADGGSTHSAYSRVAKIAIIAGRAASGTSEATNTETTIVISISVSHTETGTVSSNAVS